MGRRGFTLIELMITLIVGSITVIVAAHVAQMLVRQSASGRQKTDFNSRAQMIGKQIRADLRTAGMGSTGVLTADVGVAPWGVLVTAQTAPNNYDVIPAVVATTNAAGAPAGVGVLPGSDALMVIVPNPSAHVRTFNISPAATSVLSIDPAGPNPATALAGCNYVYIVDHSTPSGAGRTQIAAVTGLAVGTVTINGVLQFAAQPNTDVLCARVSTYWVSDDDGDGLGDWLRRTDMTGNPAPVNIGGAANPVFVDANGVGPDQMAPGVLDMQVAASFSAELWRKNGGVPPLNPNARWAFDQAGTADAFLGDATDWAEVRMVRVNVLTRKMRATTNKIDQQPQLFRREDMAAAPLPMPVNGPNMFMEPEWIVTAEAVTNLRFFDYGQPQGTLAEPM
jgi:prepilin-type N-terminal cleavage/methylation domain-containing protein